MRLVLNEIETQVQDISKEFFTNKMPITHYRSIRDSEAELCYDKALWSEMVQLGWAGILVPERNGGFDMGLAAAGVIAEQAGKTLAPSPFLSNAVIAVEVLKNSSAADTLSEIVDGTVIYGIVFEESSVSNWLKPACRFEDGVLNGKKVMGMDVVGCDKFIVSAIDENSQLKLFVIPANANGVSLTPRKMVDHRNYANVELNGVKANEYLLEISDINTVMTNTLNKARAILAAEMLGNAQATFDSTITFIKERNQFGQAISSFQALQHRASEMFVQLENARSVSLAALTSDSNSESSGGLAMLAKSIVGTTLNLITKEAVQMHGGMGVTDEFDVGFYLKRARVSEQLLGNSTACLDEYATARGF